VAYVQEIGKACIVLRASCFGKGDAGGAAEEKPERAERADDQSPVTGER